MAQQPEVTTTALERQQSAEIVRGVDSSALTGAIGEYQRIQGVLDRALPDCIMRVQGKQFRKKNYWRAVGTAFNLTVELHSEEFKEIMGKLCCLVTYAATAPNGRRAYGDGACDMGEKKGAQATIHNVRAHAHSRAYNRAVSNLVGFGEVSAEEVDRDGVGAEEDHPTGVIEVRLAAGAAAKRGWTGDAIRAVFIEAGGTFGEDGKLAAMPEANRDACIRALSRPPVVDAEVVDGGAK